MLAILGSGFPSSFFSQVRLMEMPESGKLHLSHTLLCSQELCQLACFVYSQKSPWAQSQSASFCVFYDFMESVVGFSFGSAGLPLSLCGINKH